ncbi:phage portal protein, partial [Caballeronia sp. LZ002]|nr:phage portal protein [Caballeronia sp. LZ002]
MRLFPWHNKSAPRASVVSARSVHSAQAVPVGANSFIGMIREAFAGAWQSGETLDCRENLLAFSAVYACVDRIASDIAK